MDDDSRIEHVEGLVADLERGFDAMRRTTASQ